MKFISASYQADTGESTVVMQHLGQKFTGFAHLHPDDTNPSEYVGGDLAEARATIKALKYEYKRAKEEAEISRHFVEACENYAKFNKDDDTAKCMYRQLNKRIKKVNELADEINALYNHIYTSIRLREKVLKRRSESKKDNS